MTTDSGENVLHTDDEIRRLFDELEVQRATAEQMGGRERVRKQRRDGRLDARQRIDQLMDPGSFVEYGKLSRSHRPEDRLDTPADGKVCGIGRVDARAVAVVSNDFTVKGASSSVVNGQKILHVRRLAGRYGMPVVYLSESAGARMPDRMGAAGRAVLGADPEEYLRVRATPWASALLGPCYGSAAWYAAMSDFVVMRRDAVLAVAGPRVINRALGSEVTPEELGGVGIQAKTSGLADDIADTDEEALELVKRFLALLPSHCDEAPPQSAPVEPARPPADVLDAVPASQSAVYDGHRVLDHVLDSGTLVELRRHVGRSLLAGLARLQGRPVGVICSNPIRKGGAIDVAACQKATRLLTTCDSFNLPLLMFVDTPGFLVGPEGERHGALAHIMNWMNALSQFGMPKLTVIMRKSYGQAYLNLGGGRNSHELAVWPTADLGFMDARTGAAVLSGGSASADRTEEIRRDTGPWGLAEAYRAHDVIDPRATRQWLSEALSVHAGDVARVGPHRLANWPTVA